MGRKKKTSVFRIYFYYFFFVRCVWKGYWEATPLSWKIEIFHLISKPTLLIFSSWSDTWGELMQGGILGSALAAFGPVQ